KVGTMIEIPRACLTAEEIAKEAEFFCFGTNDLTQMTFGFSRDDSGKFLDEYYKKKIYESDPFARLDQNGVGQLVSMAAAKGRKTRPDIKLGICGEHGGDPSSVEFCHKVGLTYVSCSPFRVPIARLAAAQAAINESKAKKSFIDDETRESLKEAADKAQAIAKDLAQTSAEVAKVGLESLKAGIEAAKKAFDESRKA
ncbi:MAG: pyruvate, phosphate dikinase, partial [Lachnospiraceae bacterium]|nr:pyruvate, phosphate dikinase [Lachnospiraceae bacterium]